MHEHHFVFVRQETKYKTTWSDLVVERLISDVFFCEGCLGVLTIPVRREVPSGDRFEPAVWVEVPLSDGPERP